MSDFYCDNIIKGKLKVNVVHESDLVIAFHHTRPYFEAHIVIIPKQHIDSLSSIESTNSLLAIEFMQAIQKITEQLEREWGGCRVSSNVGNYQSSKHLHWYVHAGKRLRDEAGNLINC
jgi:histidine triad (HIT) family protein